MTIQEPGWNPRRGAGMPLYLQIAVGVALGIIFAVVVIAGYHQWQLRAAAEQLQQEIRAQTAAMQARQAEADRAQQATRRATAEQAATRQRIVEAERRTALDEAERKENAWARFYEKPAACDEAKGGAWTVDCANQFIRAKRDFEAKYSAGRL